MTLAYRTDNNNQLVFVQTLKNGIESLDPRFHIQLLGLSGTNYVSDSRNQHMPIFLGGWIQDIPHPHNWLVPYLITTYADRQALPPATQASYETNINTCLASSGASAAACYQGIQALTHADALDLFLYQSYLRRYTSGALHGYFFSPGGMGPVFYQLYKSAPPEVASVEPSLESTLAFSNTEQVTTTLIIPPGAVDDTIQIVAIPDVPAYSDRFDFLLDDLAFELKAFSAGGEPLGQYTFNSPVTIQIEYGANRYSPTAESELILRWWNGTGWVDAACGAYNRDLVNHILGVPICHLSQFSISQDDYPIFMPMIWK